jgi:branched-chain amino acid aminotransferase
VARADAGVAWIDGRVVPLADARLPLTDRGFLFADSVFDTVRTYGGRPLLLGDHLDRLRASAAAVFLPIPWTDAELIGIVDAVLAAADGEASVRVIVTRGDGGAGLAFPEPQVPRLVVLGRPLQLPDPAAYRDGVALVRPADAAVKAGGVPAHVKSGSYLGNVLTLREARSRGGFEGLLRAADGTWSEATTSNLFAVRDGALRTPGLADDILPGITRALVLAVARSLGIGAVEGPLTDADLDGADELFLTSSIKEVLPVCQLDGARVGEGAPGRVTRRVSAGFHAAVARIQAAGCARLADAGALG